MILSAVEENLEEQNTEKSATAYFVSFLALTDNCFSKDNITDKDVAMAVVYLLDLVSPFVSASLLKSKFVNIFEKLAIVISHSEADAPLIRASIGVLETLLLYQDNAAWQEPSTQLTPRRAVLGLLSLGLDARPKVRRRAQEAIYKILSNPPPSPKLDHPASPLCADTALKAVKEAMDSLKKKKENEKDASAIHSIQLVKSITAANGWPIDKIDILCETLLGISKTSDQYMVVAAFSVFEAIFKGITDEVNAPKLVRILDSIFDLTPARNDQNLAPAWLAVVAQAGESYANLQPKKAFERLPEIFTAVAAFLDSESENIRISASQCLVALSATAIPAELLSKSSKGQKKVDETLASICQTVFGLMHVNYQGSWKEIMEVLVALFDTLRWRSDPHLINALKVVGALRSEGSFEDNQGASDKVIGAAIRALGPELVLSHLPLNLDDPGKAKNGRAWLLPLLRDNVQCANLSHFVEYFVPLSEQIVSRVSEMKGGIPDAKLEGQKAMQAKIFETINEQIWSLLPRYMDLPFDVRTAFDQRFAEMLANMMYQNVESRSNICQSLRLLVESNVAYSEGAVDDDILLLERFPKAEAKKNVDYMAKNFASKLLSVLFNVFTQTSPEFRGFILETITAFLSITPPDDISKTFNNVSNLLSAELEKEANEPQQKKEKQEQQAMSLTLMDLIVALTPYLHTPSHNSLLAIFVQLVQRENAPLLQKKAFRVLSRLAETEQGEATVRKNIQNIEQVFVDSTKKVLSPARGARLSAISKVLDFVPSTDLHFIPTVLPETVLSTKDVNEKTREAAFELLVQMGHKMEQGGTVQQSKIPDVGDEEAPDTEASLDEFFTMVSAGLAGDTPHMISASITALSRVIFEFRETMGMELLSQLASTVEVFLEHNNREIVKSTLGFVKITAVSLPAEIVEPQLKGLVERLMVWSHEHKAHFRAKVKHIIERLMRRFGYEKLAQVFPEDDMKLLTNIRKTKERAKKQKKSAEDEHDSAKKAKGRKFANEFDEAIYGSSSDEDSDGEEAKEEDKTAKSGKKGKRNEKYIVEGDDEPLDLLDNTALAHISSSKPQDKKQKQLKNKFSRDQSGKIVIKDDADLDEDMDNLDLKSGIDAYVQAIKSGPVKGQKNKLKYKRSRKDREESDDEGSDNEAEQKGNKRGKKPTKKDRPMKKAKVPRKKL